MQMWQKDSTIICPNFKFIVLTPKEQWQKMQEMVQQTPFSPIVFSLLCNNSVIFFFSDSGAVLRGIGRCKNPLKNAVALVCCREK